MLYPFSVSTMKKCTISTDEEGSSSQAVLTTIPVLFRTTPFDGEATKGDVQPGSRNLAKKPMAIGQPSG